MSSSSPHHHQRERATILSGLLAIVVLCGLVYTPWRREPLDLLDFSEFLLQMNRDAGPWENWLRLARYYAGHGRVNEVVYGLIAVNYSWFGLDPLSWQMMRSFQMLVIPAAVYLVLRRYGANRFGSVLGASLFLVGSVPAAGWLRQSAEPIGTLFFLAAAALVCGFSETQAPRRRALAVSASVTGMLLSKETLVACLPFLILSASCWQPDGNVRGFRVDRRTAQVVGACGVAVLVLAAALMWARQVHRADAYASLYGSVPFGNDFWSGRVLPLILPVSFAARRPAELLLFPGNLIFLGVLSTGLAASLGWANRTQVHAKLLIAATLPLAGLVIYLPWPRFEPFYGLPFLMGVGLWTAILLGQLGADSRWRAGLATCWLVVLGGSALTAAGQARYTRARREASQAVAFDLSKRSPPDTAFIASAGLSPHSWQNPAATLARYVVATRAARRRPLIVDADCDVAVDLARRPRPRTTLYVYVGVCGGMRAPDRRIERSFSRFDWYSLRLRPAAFAVDVFETP